MKLSYIILTHNRRDALLRTLGQIEASNPLPPDQYERWVVDNGSRDGTPQAVASAFPKVNLIRRDKNEGIWARQHAIDQAAGQYICFIDDDSYPLDDTVSKSIAFLDANPQAAAVTGNILLPDGTSEACALPAVPQLCGVCVRRSALEQARGLRPCKHFFRQAEEYDLAFRLLDAGYTIHRFEDLVYRHDKVPGVRAAAYVHRLDLRNNLVIAARYLPAPLRKAYQRDWSQRYTAMAKHQRLEHVARRGQWEARLRNLYESLVGRRPVNDAAIEAVLQLDHQAQAVAAWAATHNVRRVVIADFSKNIYATYRACQKADLNIAAVSDNNHAYAGTRYRGIRIKDDRCALDASIEGIVLSNVNPARVGPRLAQLQDKFQGPILTLWQPQALAEPATTLRQPPQPAYRVAG